MGGLWDLGLEVGEEIPPEVHCGARNRALTSHRPSGHHLKRVQPSNF